MTGTDGKLARLASRQHGVVTRTQALHAGVGPGAIRDRLRRGALHPLHRGVYLVGHPVPPPLALEQAALLAAGPASLIARRSAAVLWGLAAPGAGARVNVLVVGAGGVRSRPGLDVRRTGALLDPADVRRIEGLPVTSPARTLVDLASSVDEAELERLVHEAQVLRAASPAAVRSALDRAGVIAGAARLRRVLAAGGTGGTRSEAERLLLRVLRDARLPRPQCNTRLAGFEVDALWRRERLVVEVDGFAAHGTRRAFERDRRRDMELQLRGYRVVRVTWRQLRDEPLAVAARLGALMAPMSPEVRR